MTCDCYHIWNYSVEIRSTPFTEKDQRTSHHCFSSAVRSYEPTRNLENNIEAVCVAADAINLIVSNAEVSRFAAGLDDSLFNNVQQVKAKSTTFTYIQNHATYTWTLSLNCWACMSLVRCGWRDCFEKPAESLFF